MLIIDPEQAREKENWFKFMPAVFKVKGMEDGGEAGKST